MLISALVDRIRSKLPSLQYQPHRSTPFIIDHIQDVIVNDIIPDLCESTGFIYLEELYRKMGLTLVDTDNTYVKLVELEDVRTAVYNYELTTKYFHEDSLELWIVDTLYDSYGGGGFVAAGDAPGGTPSATTDVPPYTNRYYVNMARKSSAFTHSFYSLGNYPSMVEGARNGENIEVHNVSDSYDYAFAEFIVIPEYGSITTATDLTDFSNEIINGLVIPSVCGRVVRADGGEGASMISANFRGEYNSKLSKLRRRAKKMQSVTEVTPQYKNRRFYEL